MPFHLPFNFPYFYNTQKSNPYINNQMFEKSKSYYDKNNYINQKKNSEDTKSESPSEYFLEIFGLHLYFDDVLILCILFFLYTEEVRDQELFICLILLLLS